MKPFILHFNRLGHKRGDRDVWTIRVGRRNRYARSVRVHVPLRTVYRGHTAAQPRAYLTGKGVVRIVGRTAIIREG